MHDLVLLPPTPMVAQWPKNPIHESLPPLSGLCLCLCIPWLSGCSNSGDNLDNQISESLDNDNAIDVTEKRCTPRIYCQESKELGKDQKTTTLLTPDGKIERSQPWKPTLNATGRTASWPR